MQRPLSENDAAKMLRICAEDPMWVAHSEVSKTLLLRAAREIESLREKLSAADVQPVAAQHDVRNILLAVVPGEDGMGHEVFAKSVDEVVNQLTAMGQRIEEFESALVAQPVVPQEPFGHIAVYPAPDANHVTRYVFYPFGQPPYLDNAAACHTVYLAPVAAAPAAPAAPVNPTMTRDELIAAAESIGMRFPAPAGESHAPR